MLLNFIKFMGLLTGMTSLTFFIFLIYFFQFHPLILNWLIIEFYNLLYFVF
jgi:hypothetical protein